MKPAEDDHSAEMTLSETAKVMICFFLQRSCLVFLIKLF